MSSNLTPTLLDAVQFIKGVGPKRAELLKRMGLETAEDCLHLLPARYEDRTQMRKIAELQAGEIVTIKGTIADAGVVRLGRRKRLFELVVQDDNSQISAKWFKFRDAYMSERFSHGLTVLLSGKVTTNKYLGVGLEMVHPDVEIIEDEGETPGFSGQIIPVYPSTEGLNQKNLRQVMSNVVEKYTPLLEEFIPEDILSRNNLPNRRHAFEHTHYPPPEQSLKELETFRAPGQRRLIFEELFLLQLSLALKRQLKESEDKGVSFKTRGPLIQQFVKHLPFELTGAQKKVLGSIMDDLELEKPMNRLLHGDVGSGKTMVALITLLTAIDNGFQGTLMAPTELLAEQHFNGLKPFCDKLGIRIGLASSALTQKERSALRSDLESGAIQLAVGTHSLIQKDVNFKQLGLVVIDEQHRFGVLQREALGKKGFQPHILVMTATPIPRSLAMTLYGDMDVCKLDEMPPGRQPITTRKFYENRREEAYKQIDGEIKKGRQAYIVCPLIDESEKVDLHNATEVFDELSRQYPGWRMGLLHGRIKNDQRQKMMQDFKNGELQVLVATTVIEVGIDVPNATTILIEHAERFGLAQLHQLRGRVGRGQFASHCLLVAHHPISPEAKQRLDAMVKSQDGFLIAEEDLNIRGPGDFMGTRQSGLPLLRIANLIRDAEFISIARKEAFGIIKDDPTLSSPEHAKLKQALRHYIGDRADLATVL